MVFYVSIISGSFTKEKICLNINGFEVRFFLEKEILDLIAKKFKKSWMKEEYEEPVTLYLVVALKLKEN